MMYGSENEKGKLTKYEVVKTCILYKLIYEKSFILLQAKSK